MNLEKQEKSPKTPRDIELIVNKYSNPSYKTQSQIADKALIQRRIYEQAIELTGDTIEDKDKEVELKGNKIN